MYGPTVPGRQSRIHVLLIKKLEICEGSFWTRLWGAHALRVTAKIGTDLRQVVICLGSREGLTAFKSEIFIAVTNALAAQEDRLTRFCEKFEKERDIVFVANRYVRHSKLQNLISKNAPEFQAVSNYYTLWSEHPLRAPSPEGDEIERRFGKIKRVFENSKEVRAEHNEAFMRAEAEIEAKFFSNVEDTTLNKEQVRASLAFDDANVTVAAAGSGKTSVMVSKIGYAIKSSLFREDEVIALAYNKEAAKELQVRIAEKIGAALERGVRVEARTFHSLGLKLWLKNRNLFRSEVAKGRPKLVTFDGPSGKRLLKKLLLDLVESNGAFARDLLQWAATYRYPEPDIDPCNAGTADEQEKRYHDMCKRISRSAKKDKWYEPSIPTFDPNTFVRSNEEASIVNWLYLRGVDFDYERSAPGWITDKINEGLSAEERVRIYKPDFSYANPQDKNKRFIHEHFGLDAAGRAPQFLGNKYERRAVHKRRVLRELDGPQTSVPRFFETRSGHFRDGTLFKRLKEELEKRSIHVGDIDRDRRDRALKELADSDSLLELISEFVAKFRDSGLSFDDVNARIQGIRVEERARASSFVKWMRVYLSALQTVMDKGLPAGEGKPARPLIDFAGMISSAIALLTDKDHSLTTYKMVLVDEFQDISRLRAQFVQGLLNQHPNESLLFCVGDDWQAINRFAGADVGIFRMTYDGLDAEIEKTARGPIKARSTHQTQLKTTFRSAQGIADVARWFVMRTGEGTLIDKDVNAADPRVTNVIRVVEHGDSELDRVAALRLELERIGKIHQRRAGKGGPATVFLLTRNRRDNSLPEGLNEAMFLSLAAEFSKHGLDVVHRSLHGSKGLGRDYVIILGMDSGWRGFPRDIGKEPLIEILLPPQRAAIDEERRLFYVGLTRAKREVTLLCVAERPSMFVKELEKYPIPGVIQWNPLVGVSRELCPNCGMGWLRLAKGRPSVECTRTAFCGFVAPLELFPNLRPNEVAAKE